VTWILFLLFLLNNVLLFLFLSSPKSSTSVCLLVFFLNSSKSVQSILFLKSQFLIRKALLNYHPVSHSFFLSKLTESTVQHRLMNHLSVNDLLNSFQSAYVKSHSTETTLLSVHDYIIRAVSLLQVTCICLLDLSAAFDTIDHSILLEHLRSWFGFNNFYLILD
jgi:hypothetical protein